MDITTLPGYSAFVTAITTSPQYKARWAAAQKANQTSDQFAGLMVSLLMTKVVGQVNLQAVAVQNRVALTTNLAATNTLISSANLSASSPTQSATPITA